VAPRVSGQLSGLAGGYQLARRPPVAQPSGHWRQVLAGLFKDVSSDGVLGPLAAAGTGVGCDQGGPVVPVGLDRKAVQEVSVRWLS
jgi:hypothetical protein